MESIKLLFRGDNHHVQWVENDLVHWNAPRGIRTLEDLRSIYAGKVKRVQYQYVTRAEANANVPVVVRSVVHDCYSGGGRGMEALYHGQILCCKIMPSSLQLVQINESNVWLLVRARGFAIALQV